MKQMVGLKGRNHEEVGRTKYFEILNKNGFLEYLHRESECKYYDIVYETALKIQSVAAKEYKKLQQQQQQHSEILPKDERKHLISLFEGLDEICRMAKFSCQELNSCTKLLSSVKIGSKKHRFSSEETAGYYDKCKLEL